ncbi:lipid-A-disaccharide synthase [Fimbriimonas ginsengisoli]|uniref:Lipid-A-disaccharide synthase n=1 Tax=Fimbriimonas ginsengisoli Gsoil 348 TaxID=661478 RepID=A0A068NQ29_FIMGI|nr:hypothetical protein [Fimbriimonas ginsengisoli]AIE85653.1 lipid-a-disaccharide synthase [Fimbriimonas ginsengisoli Gsoil 348]
MRIFISAGEASGDAYGAALAREMQRLSPRIEAKEFEEIVRGSMFWPAAPDGATPDESSEKIRNGFSELLGYALEDYVPSDLNLDDLFQTPWAEIPARLYERLIAECPGRMTPHLYAGIGGRRMREAGIDLVADSGNWGAISITQSLKVVPRVLGGYFAAKTQLRQDAPGLFIPIDFGYANIRLARHAKRFGWKVLYFVPPGSWRRDRQGRDLPQLTDAISTPFEWSAEILRRMGANAHWFGHPIKQLLGDARARNEIRQGVAILPGSRRHEIAENLPLIAEVLSKGDYGPAEFGLAPTVDVEDFRKEWTRLAPSRPGDRFTAGDTAGVLRRGRAGIVCSGTATLEAALCECPMVVVYRLSPAVMIEAKLLRIKRPKFIALPNILLDRTLVPEFVQDEATPAAVAEALTAIWKDGQARESQLQGFRELDILLGPDDAITQTAKLALLVASNATP